MIGAYDTVFRDITVVDGTGGPRYRADVGVAGRRIAEVNAQSAIAGQAAREIGGTGLVLAPGFIDMHAHSDLALLTDRDHLAKLGQGCTLEVLGQDGLSYAPTDDDTMARLWDQLASWNGRPGDISRDWRSVAQYLERLDAGIATNAAYLIPHGTVRMRVMGFADRVATHDEIAAMCALVDEGMRQGAVGLSAGLTYPPGMYADTAELVALCEVVARRGGYFSPHQRSYGAGALEAYGEMIEVARSSDCALHLAHATMNFPVNAGRGQQLLDLVDEAIAAGVDVTLDTYPYLPGATSLSALLPSWSMEGGPEACARRLQDSHTRARVRHELEVTGTDGCHGVPVDWDLMEISGVADPQNDSLVGLTVAQAAARHVVPATEFYLDLLLEERFGTSCLMHVGHEDNVRTIMTHARHTAGSDGLLHGDKPHPRAWGTFPRYLGHYVRELGLLSLEDCVAHLTSRAARRLGLADRGVVRPEAVADLVVFDAETVADTATFAAPRQAPAGIGYVMVNGTLSIDAGRRTAALAGGAVRSTRSGRG